MLIKGSGDRERGKVRELLQALLLDLIVRSTQRIFIKSHAHVVVIVNDVLEVGMCFCDGVTM